jgi:glycosyltransferase involved in cell wall biosynthesis
MTQTTPFRVLAVIPALNEEETIAGVLDELRKFAPEIVPLVVDDGSTDATAEIARLHGARVASLPMNLGIGGAVQTGFILAAREQFDALVQVDADGQHDPRELAKILGPLRAGEANVVIGSRFIGDAEFAHSAHRLFLIRFFARLVSLATGRTLTDTSSSFRAYDARAIAFCADNYPHGFLESIEATVLLARNGMRLTEVPVHVRQRQAGETSLSLGRTVVYTAKVVLAIAVSLTRRPIETTHH